MDSCIRRVVEPGSWGAGKEIKGGIKDEYHKNALYEILKDLVKYFKRVYV